MYVLPDDLLRLIFTQLSPIDKIKFCHCNHHFNSIISPQLWKYQLLCDFLVTIPSSDNYRHLYLILTHKSCQPYIDCTNYLLNYTSTNFCTVNIILDMFNLKIIPPELNLIDDDINLTIQHMPPDCIIPDLNNITLSNLELICPQFTTFPNNLKLPLFEESIKITGPHNKLMYIHDHIFLNFFNNNSLYINDSHICFDSPFPHFGEFLKNSPITSIDFSNNNLQTIPIYLFNLPKLTNLILDDNKITHIPLDIQSSTNLQYLSLSDNLITDIPSHITKLTSLQTINLSTNPISVIPSYFESFILSHNIILLS